MSWSAFLPKVPAVFWIIAGAVYVAVLGCACLFLAGAAEVSNRPHDYPQEARSRPAERRLG